MCFQSYIIAMSSAGSESDKGQQREEATSRGTGSHRVTKSTTDSLIHGKDTSSQSRKCPADSSLTYEPQSVPEAGPSGSGEEVQGEDWEVTDWIRCRYVPACHRVLKACENEEPADVVASDIASLMSVVLSFDAKHCMRSAMSCTIRATQPVLPEQYTMLQHDIRALGQSFDEAIRDRSLSSRLEKLKPTRIVQLVHNITTSIERRLRRAGFQLDCENEVFTKEIISMKIGQWVPGTVAFMQVHKQEHPVHTISTFTPQEMEQKRLGMSQMQNVPTNYYQRSRSRAITYDPSIAELDVDILAPISRQSSVVPELLSYSDAYKLGVRFSHSIPIRTRAVHSVDETQPERMLQSSVGSTESYNSSSASFSELSISSSKSSYSHESSLNLQSAPSPCAPQRESQLLATGKQTAKVRPRSSGNGTEMAISQRKSMRKSCSKPAPDSAPWRIQKSGEEGLHERTIVRPLVGLETSLIPRPFEGPDRTNTGQLMVGHMSPAPTTGSATDAMTSPVSLPSDAIILISVDIDRVSLSQDRGEPWIVADISTTLQNVVFGRQHYVIHRSSQSVAKLHAELQASFKIPPCFQAPTLKSDKQLWKHYSEVLLQFVASSPKLRATRAFLDFIKPDVSFSPETPSAFVVLESMFFSSQNTVQHLPLPKQEENFDLAKCQWEEQPTQPEKFDKYLVAEDKDHSIKLFLLYNAGEPLLLLSKEGTTYSVIAGMFPQLVAQVVWMQDVDQISTLTLAYRNFAKPADLLHVLVSLFHQGQSNAINDSDKGSQTIAKFPHLPLGLESEAPKAMQERSLKVITYWVTTCRFDMVCIEEDLQRFISELKQSKIQEEQLAGKHLSQTLQKYKLSISRKQSYHNDHEYSRTILITKDMEKQISRQLSLTELELFQSFDSYALACSLWGHDDSSEDQEATADLRAYLLFFKQIKLWVPQQIYLAKTPTKRANQIEAWIRIAEHCLSAECRNANTAMAIVHGLRHSAVADLIESWKMVSKKAQESWKNIKELMSRSGNYRKYRDYEKKQHHKVGGFIPAFRLAMKDMKSLNSERPANLRNGLLDFSKVQAIVSQFKELRRLQHSVYYFFPSSRSAVKVCDSIRSSNPHKLAEWLEGHKHLELRELKQSLNTQPAQSTLSESVDQSSSKGLNDFQQMMASLGSSLTEVDVLAIARVETIPNSLVSGPAVAPPLIVIGHLYARGAFSPDDVKSLKELLHNIGRDDLLEKVVEPYQRSVLCTDPTEQNLKEENAQSTQEKPLPLSCDRSVPQVCSGQEGRCVSTTYYSKGFVDSPDLATFTSKGGTYYNAIHGIKVIIPPGAISSGKTVEMTVGIALTTTFHTPHGGRIVSPVVMLCTPNPNYEFQTPVEVTLPHYFICSDSRDCDGLSFLKAGHDENGKQIESFTIPDGEMLFNTGSNFGTLRTKHFCYLCIQYKKVSLTQPLKLQFCLMGAIPDLNVLPPPRPTSWEVYLCLIYLLPTCREVSSMDIVFLHVHCSKRDFCTCAMWHMHSEAKNTVIVLNTHYADYHCVHCVTIHHMMQV